MGNRYLDIETRKDFAKAAVKTDGPYKLTSGETSDVYVDVKSAVMSNWWLRKVGKAMRELSHKYSVDAIGGVELGGVPVAAACLALETWGKDGFVVRKDRKSHGTESRVEGTLKRGQGVLLIEDVVTTGGSLESAADAVKAFGAVIKCVACVVNRNPGGETPAALRGYRFESLFTLDELLGHLGRK